MENNGKGIFYGVIGVATLIVAIIGATFAFFSASQTNSDTIQGNTLDVAGNFTLAVEKITFDDATAPSNDLVPAELDGSGTEGINRALTANCEKDGYTGCHLYKITATSGQKLTTASITIDSLTTTAGTKTNWKYSVFKGSQDNATDLVKNDTFENATGYDMHQNAAVEASTPVEYYLLVYLENIDSDQSGAESGSYTGSISFKAAGSGEISASFAA